jgi:hypothetical protein
VFLEREPIVLGVGPDVGQCGLAIDKAWEIGRLAGDAAAPRLLGVDDPLRLKIAFMPTPMSTSTLPYSR